MTTRRVLLVGRVAALLVPTVVLGACGGGGNEPTQKGDTKLSGTPSSTPASIPESARPRGGTLRVSISLPASNLDPENVQGDGDAWTDAQIFEHLLEYKP